MGRAAFGWTHRVPGPQRHDADGDPDDDGEGEGMSDSTASVGDSPPPMRPTTYQ